MMRTIVKACAATLLLSSLNLGYATPTCPSVANALQQVGAASLSAATAATGGGYVYSGTSSYDNSTVYYFTQIQPTTITPNHQLQRLEPVLSAPTQVASTSTTVTCAYLGGASGSAAPFTPTYDPTWGQAIVITSTGGSGPGPGPGPDPGPAPSPGPTPLPYSNLPGLPTKYMAMGDITQGINQFTYTDKAGAQHYLDADYLYASPNGDGSVGTLLGPPNISQSLGKNWFKVFYLLHHATSAGGNAAPASVAAVPVYYTTAAGSGGLATVFVNGGQPNLAPYSAAPDMSPGNLTGQYVNLINFLALIRNESIRQPGLTVAILYNPDLLGKMFQEGLSDGGTSVWLDYKFNDIRSSLENAINAVPFPNGTSIVLDPAAQQILKQNLALIEKAMTDQGDCTMETGRAYLNSISILTKVLLSRPNCATCQNITYGWHLNAWLAGGNANNLRSPGAGAKFGASAAAWLLGTNLFSSEYAANFIAFDKYEADGLTASAVSNGYFWNWQTLDEYVSFVSTIAHDLSPDPANPVPVMLWQIPASHFPNVNEVSIFPYMVTTFPKMAARMDNNTNYIFGDSYINLNYQLGKGASPLVTGTTMAQIGTYAGAAPSNYYCGSSSTPACSAVSVAQAAGVSAPSDWDHYTKGHLADLAKAGVIAILWGGGDYHRTTGGYCPFDKDCVEPTATNVPGAYNNDNGWLAMVMRNYYAAQPSITSNTVATPSK